jgi:hypothetical protein
LNIAPSRAITGGQPFSVRAFSWTPPISAWSIGAFFYKTSKFLFQRFINHLFKLNILFFLNTVNEQKQVQPILPTNLPADRKTPQQRRSV